MFRLYFFIFILYSLNTFASACYDNLSKTYLELYKKKNLQTIVEQNFYKSLSLNNISEFIVALGSSGDENSSSFATTIAKKLSVLETDKTLDQQDIYENRLLLVLFFGKVTTIKNTETIKILKANDKNPKIEDFVYTGDIFIPNSGRPQAGHLDAPKIPEKIPDVLYRGLYIKAKMKGMAQTWKKRSILEQLTSFSLIGRILSFPFTFLSNISLINLRFKPSNMQIDESIDITKRDGIRISDAGVYPYAHTRVRNETGSFALNISTYIRSIYFTDRFSSAVYYTRGKYGLQKKVGSLSLVLELDSKKYVEKSNIDTKKYKPIRQQIMVYQGIDMFLKSKDMPEWFIVNDIPSEVIRSFWIQMEDPQNGPYYMEIKNPKYK